MRLMPQRHQTCHGIRRFRHLARFHLTATASHHPRALHQHNKSRHTAGRAHPLARAHPIDAPVAARAHTHTGDGARRQHQRQPCVFPASSAQAGGFPFGGVGSAALHRPQLRRAVPRVGHGRRRGHARLPRHTMTAAGASPVVPATVLPTACQGTCRGAAGGHDAASHVWHGASHDMRRPRMQHRSTPAAPATACRGPGGHGAGHSSATGHACQGGHESWLWRGRLQLVCQWLHVVTRQWPAQWLQTMGCHGPPDLQAAIRGL